MESHKLEVVKGITDCVKANLGLLKPVEDCWQPSDFLPDLTREDWREALSALRETAAGLPDDILVILVGTMVTEEALPSYQTSLNRLVGVGDVTGADDTPWGKWSRGWTAEENRHGDLLNRYLYTTGRVDMRAIEQTIQHLIRNGFDPRHDNDPYNGMIYTSFQERATKVSHQKVGALAKSAGEKVLNEICTVISADEARHEEGYKRFMAKVFEVDPSHAILSLQTMMERSIIMPAYLMYDGENKSLFADFSRVAQKNGVYTFDDYLAILEHFLAYWKIADLKGLSGDAAKAQDKICALPGRMRRRRSFMASRIDTMGSSPFRWIHNRAV